MALGAHPSKIQDIFIPPSQLPNNWDLLYISKIDMCGGME